MDIARVETDLFDGEELQRLSAVFSALNTEKSALSANGEPVHNEMVALLRHLNGIAGARVWRC
jgi:PII-like signaling protein